MIFQTCIRALTTKINIGPAWLYFMSAYTEHPFVVLKKKCFKKLFAVVTMQHWYFLSSCSFSAVFLLCHHVIIRTPCLACRSWAWCQWSAPTQALSERTCPAIQPWWWWVWGWPRGTRSSTPGSTSCCAAPSYARSTSSPSARQALGGIC